MRELRQEADGMARALTDQAIGQLHALVSLLNGVLHGESGERYDTLSNLEQLGGRENKTLLADVEAASSRIAEAWNLLCEIRDVELAS